MNKVIIKPIFATKYLLEESKDLTTFFTSGKTNFLRDHFVNASRLRLQESLRIDKDRK